MIYDVLVIGGGHAGCEAAAASARIGAKTILITPKIDNIGEMSCNPAIGGVGKGILVKEIDALNGLMPQAIDKASIHSKILNQSRGAAVWGPRAQADRELYKKAMQELMLNYSNITILEDKVEDIIVSNKIAEGVTLSTNNSIKAHTIILTTGTFLNGMIHIGTSLTPAGRYGERPSIALAHNLLKHKFSIGRLKTGTPPRLDKNSINWDVLSSQEGDIIPRPFSFATTSITIPQIKCYITHTNEKTHQILHENLQYSALQNGLQDKGPRYCPSIEDKISRFASKTSHQIFLEPEGLNSNLIYPNGLSNSLPPEIQDKFLRSIKGLENVIVKRYGYNIAYDYIDPRELYPTLETKKIKNLFFAGQINGTTGYEEAAAQGLIAGANAALKSLNKDQTFILKRSQAYIGVLIDDLVTQGIDGEPYRIFTSRAEYRLTLRADNADERLTELGCNVGLVSEKCYHYYLNKKNFLQETILNLKNLKITPHALQKTFNLNIAQDGVTKSAFELLQSPTINIKHIKDIWPTLQNLPLEIGEIVETIAKYEPYLKKQSADIKMFNDEENIKIPLDINFYEIDSLSTEVKEKLYKIKPLNIGSAKRIPGITPAAIATLLIYLRYKHPTKKLNLSSTFDFN